MQNDKTKHAVTGVRHARTRSIGRNVAALGVASVVIGAAFSTISVAQAEVGAEGMPSLRHVDGADRTDAPRFSARNPAARRVRAASRSADEIERFRADQAASREAGKPLLIGTTRALPARDRDIQASRLTWHAVPGGHAAVLDFHADAAKGLRLSFKLVGPAHGVTLRFAGSAQPDEVFEIAGAATLGTPKYWGPVTEGESMRVEIFVEEGVAHRGVRLAQVELMHLDQIAPTDAALPTAGGLGNATLPCHRDVACRPDQSQAYQDASRSVAGLSFVVGSQGYWCTGTLVNSNTLPRQPYLVTANHCINTQAVASTLFTVWFMDATACGSGERSGKYTVLREGATLLYNTTYNDHAFLRLNGRLPDGVFYAGWSPNPLGVGANALGMHHPAADLKKYSEGYKEKDNSNLSGLSGTYHQMRWNVGTVEGGSSGSGLFAMNPQTGAFQIVGQLYGVINSASCTTSAVYGRLQDHVPTLRQWLDPIAPLAIQNAASAQGLDLAPDELVAAWGPGLPASVVTRLPSDRADPADPRCALTIGGRYSVRTRSVATGEIREACTLFLGGNQVNFKMPGGLNAGERVDVEVFDNATQTPIAVAPWAPIVDFAPGFFTQSSDGKGVAAGNLVRVKGGEQKWSNVPPAGEAADLGPADEDLFLVLYGTGLRYKPGTTTPTATIGGIAAPVEYVGSQRDYLGLDQVNLRVPKAALRAAGLAGTLIVEVRFTDASGRESVPNKTEINLR